MLMAQVDIRRRPPLGHFCIAVYQEQQPDQSTALKRELAIKALSRTAKEVFILKSHDLQR